MCSITPKHFESQHAEENSNYKSQQFNQTPRNMPIVMKKYSPKRRQEAEMKFAQAYSREDLAKLRQFISQMTEEDSENLPFSLQSELYKLSETIMAKFRKTSASNLFQLKQGRLHN